MKPSPPKQYFAAAHRVVADSDTIEWEELPSLAASLSQRLVPRGVLARAASGSLARLMGAAAGLSTRLGAEAAQASSLYVAPWQSTVIGTFYELEPSAPFREVLFGVATREVHEPDVFAHFFGAAAQRN